MRISRSHIHFESVEEFDESPVGEYTSVVSIDNENRISIGLFPSKSSQKPSVHITLGKGTSNKLMMMIGRLGFHSIGGDLGG